MGQDRFLENRFEKLRVLRKPKYVSRDHSRVIIDDGHEDSLFLSRFGLKAPIKSFLPQEAALASQCKAEADRARSPPPAAAHKSALPKGPDAPYGVSRSGLASRETSFLKSSGYR